jgi:hypothetical protein
VIAVLLAPWLPAEEKRVPLTDPAKADADFAIQGEYTGEMLRDEKAVKVAVQVVALGEGKFRAFAYTGGLPGEVSSEKHKEAAEGATEGDAVVFRLPRGTVTIRKGVMSLVDAQGKPSGELEKVSRKSPTLGAKPPAGALVLFDGSNADAWENGLLTEDKLLAWKPGTGGTTTKKKFQDCAIHVEFRTPYMPWARGQDRGNSGVYVQGRFEVQVLDSFGLEAKDNECGGIYSVGPPKVNACLPPLEWQTYDIDFQAARCDAAGKKLKHARMTVKHNGILIHEDREVDHDTTARPNPEGPSAEGVFLQDHGCPVRYRNIWVVEKP